MKTSISRRSVFQYTALFIYIFASGLLLTSSNVVYDIFAFCVLVFGAMSIVKFDVAHPFVWFSFVFMLYSISYPILYLNGILYDVYTYTDSLMFSQWLALVVFLFCIGPSQVDYSRLKDQKTTIISNRIFLIMVSIILFATILKISTGGYSHKHEIYAEGSLVVFIGFRAALIFLMLYAINLSVFAIKENKIDYKLTIFIFGVIFLMVFFSGERDLIIRALVILFFIYYIIVKKSKLTREIIILGAVSLSLIPILGQYKYFGLTGKKTSSGLNFFLSFLTSDFQSASKNLQILLLDESAKGKFKGATFITSFLRAFNLDKVLGIDAFSSGGWYNETYFEAGRAGQGFTLVGDGYVNFGYIGIIILFIFVGISVRFLYKQSNKGIYCFVFYILSIPVFMYAIRADLANILSPLIKQNLLTIILLRLILKVLYGAQKSRKTDEINKIKFT